MCVFAGKIATETKGFSVQLEFERIERQVRTTKKFLKQPPACAREGFCADIRAGILR
jgi:hypothetical protein